MEKQHLIAGLLASGLVVTAACAQPDRPAVDEQAAAADVAGADRDVRPDATISTEIQSRYYSDDALRGRRIDVRVNDGFVALDGTVSDDAARQRAVALAKDVAGVREVDNRIDVAPEGATRDDARSARADDAARDADGPSIPGATDVNAGWITTKIQAAYFVDGDVKGRNIDVTTTDTGTVTLEGHVDSEQASKRAAEIARGTDGVRRVDNQLRVEGATESGVTTARREDDATGDGWVTMKIQSKYFLDGDVSGRRIDVDTQNGVVTLTGDVRTEEERRQAVALARNTDGVQSVNDQLRLVAETDASDVAASEPSRSPVDVVDDAWVTTKIQSKYFLEEDVKGRDIDVTARDGVVTLTGAVASDTARRTAESIARDTDGVTRVVNRLRVAPEDAGAGDDDADPRD